MRKVVIYIEEVWKDINEFKGYYQVSNFGRIKSLFRYVKVKNGFRSVPEKILKPKIDKDGYLHVVLQKDRKSRYLTIHRIVADTFIDNPNNLPHVNHKNENKQDNRVENLEWCTEQYNCNYGTRNLRRAESQSKEVCQYDKDGNLIATYKNTKIASENTGIVRFNIINVCNNRRKVAGGYVWKYRKEMM